jgi:hypothetical protein
MQIRILATAADSGKSWDLRCEIREKLLTYVQKNHPESLPRIRTELDGGRTEMGPRSGHGAHSSPDLAALPSPKLNPEKNHVV